MSQYLLDTNICIHFIKGEFDLANRVQQAKANNCFISALTFAELLYGVANSAPTKQAANRQNVEAFRRLFDQRILSVESCFEIYAQQKAHLKRIGRLQGEFDMLIGCTALAHGLTLVTRNTRHFTDLPGLRLENWIDAPPALPVAPPLP